MPDKKDDKPDSLDRVHGDRGLTRRSGFMARRVRELAEKARELNLTDDVAVVFADKNLEAAVREKLEKPEGPLTRGNLKRLATLHCDSTGIRNAASIGQSGQCCRALDAGSTAPRTQFGQLGIGERHDTKTSWASPFGGRFCVHSIRTSRGGPDDLS